MVAGVDKVTFGFPPIATPDASVLILGTLPGAVSLARREYYADTRNAFWTILAAGLGFSIDADYGARTAILTKRKIALWDVLVGATRQGSRDMDIEGDATPNDFQAFFRIHADIRLIAFNGSKAERLYRRHVMPALAEDHRKIERHILPSTSGLNTRMNSSQKVKRWSIVWEHVESSFGR